MRLRPTICPLVTVGLFLITACASQSTSQSSCTDKIDCQCRLFFLAASKLTESDRGRESHIVAGCPGQFSNFEPSDRAQRQHAMDASVVVKPSGVLEKGGDWIKLYDILLLRGVPASVAEALIETEEYRDAV